MGEEWCGGWGGVRSGGVWEDRGMCGEVRECVGVGRKVWGVGMKMEMRKGLCFQTVRYNK